MNPKSSSSEKISAFREIHAVSKTKVLLLRDLPFVMNLSKYYDPDILDPKRESLSRLGNNSDTPSKRGISFLDTETHGYEKHHTSLMFNTLERVESGNTLDDELTERLREQTKNIDKHEENTGD
jgi:hypothetical protein